ncbi:hypothetical protein Ahy_B01g052462 isoform C [Arachis hypogaea]|uniref:Uncharacterized protein n=1 Tax=Arachis hypogaea TaxID=3818 RepID=A0A445API1_ARAHY|nr:hypothetical protein Ahy_B01g052462 isoform C [Arachis hypogaea]
MRTGLILRGFSGSEYIPKRLRFSLKNDFVLVIKITKKIQDTAPFDPFPPSTPNPLIRLTIIKNQNSTQPPPSWKAAAPTLFSIHCPSQLSFSSLRVCRCAVAASPLLAVARRCFFPLPCVIYASLLLVLSGCHLFSAPRQSCRHCLFAPHRVSSSLLLCFAPCLAVAGSLPLVVSCSRCWVVSAPCHVSSPFWIRVTQPLLRDLIDLEKFPYGGVDLFIHVPHSQLVQLWFDFG